MPLSARTADVDDLIDALRVWTRSAQDAAVVPAEALLEADEPDEVVLLPDVVELLSDDVDDVELAGIDPPDRESVR
ncbi:hypothetical protein [Austwickia sp. TVS 96-490-7B]|uniref:hypothetical protein n=1 Tax=Austwickia sp. TVS 96-490-7B TaxID=2830843 RepID=UPI00351D6D88